MSEVKVLSADEAEGMSRAEALRAMATAEGVSERDRRLALIMLEGPEITGADQHVLQTKWPMKGMVQAVYGALMQLGHEVRQERANAQTDLRELAGA